MARRLGYLTIAQPGSVTVEMDTALCAHCQAIIPLHRPDGTRVPSVAMCLNCGPAQVCDACDRDGRCTPFLRKVEAMEARARLFAALDMEH